MIHMVWWLQHIWLGAPNTHEKHQCVYRLQNLEACGSTGDVPITGSDSHTLWLISLCLLCSDSLIALVPKESHSVTACICKIQSIFPISDSNLGRKNGNDFSVYLNAVAIIITLLDLESISHHWRLLCSETVPSIGQNYCSTSNRIQCSIKWLIEALTF